MRVQLGLGEDQARRGLAHDGDDQEHPEQVQPEQPADRDQQEPQGEVRLPLPPHRFPTPSQRRIRFHQLFTPVIYSRLL